MDRQAERGVWDEMRYLVIATPEEKKLIKDYQAYDEVIVTGVGYDNVWLMKVVSDRLGYDEYEGMWFRK